MYSFISKGSCLHIFKGIIVYARCKQGRVPFFELATNTKPTFDCLESIGDTGVLATESRLPHISLYKK